LPLHPRVTERRADFLARLVNGRIILVEIQVLFDPALPLRMVEYCLRVKERYGVYPDLFILWLGEGKPPYEGSFTLGPITLKCVVVDIKEIPSEVLLGSEDENDLLLSVLCKRGEGFWEVLSERLMRLPEGKRKEAVLKLAYLVKLRKDLLEEYNRLREEEEKMPIVIDFENDPAYVRGLIQDAQELVVEALEERFGSVPVSVKRKVMAIEDREVLKRLHREAIRARSLRAFQKKLEGV
jgi:hypothetical protein